MIPRKAKAGSSGKERAAAPARDNDDTIDATPSRQVLVRGGDGFREIPEAVCEFIDNSIQATEHNEVRLIKVLLGGHPRRLSFRPPSPPPRTPPS